MLCILCIIFFCGAVAVEVSAVLEPFFLILVLEFAAFELQVLQVAVLPFFNLFRCALENSTSVAGL